MGNVRNALTVRRQFAFGPRRLAGCLAGVVLLALAGCADLGYYLQSAQGHLTMMHSAKPVDDWLADPALAPGLKRQLELAHRIRRFAVTELALPDNSSYTRYADLKRGAVVWNVVAAPALSLTLKTWCFPVAGCVGYRGYFDEAQANALAAQMQAEGLEASVYGVPAYSTLGWMNWAGGDPLLSTFIHYPEDELARLIFHELAHQVAYAKDDTAFNESFATAVERLGARRWQAKNPDRLSAAALSNHTQRREQFRSLTQATRHELLEIYADKDKKGLPGDRNEARLASKKAAMDKFRRDYAQLKSTWLESANSNTSISTPALTAQNFAGYDRWVARANNASFGAQAAYDSLVPQFEALHAKSADWLSFYHAVKRLAELPAAQRRDAMAALLAETTEPAPAIAGNRSAEKN